jgi:hypothetical protein
MTLTASFADHSISQGFGAFGLESPTIMNTIA